MGRTTEDGRSFAAVSSKALLLKRAMEEGDLVARYQPIFSASNAKIRAAEALCRWRCRNGRLKTAAKFIDAAKKSSVIENIDTLMINEALDLASSSVRLGVANEDFVVHVNVSAELLSSSSFIDIFARALNKGSSNPSRLIVEVDECISVQRHTLQFCNLMKLSQLGVGLALDDFSTRNCGLAAVSLLPISTIKLDKSVLFLARESEKARKLVRWVCCMAADLGAKLVVEGVETAADLQIASECGASLVQGYYYGKAVSAKEICRQLRSS